MPLLLGIGLVIVLKRWLEVGSSLGCSGLNHVDGLVGRVGILTYGECSGV